MFRLEFHQEYNDCNVGLLYVQTSAADRKVVCRVLYPKKYPISHLGKPFKLEGQFKVSYTFEDGYYSLCLVVNRRPLRIRMLDELEAEYSPLYAGPALYAKFKMNVSKSAWTDTVRSLQARGHKSVVVDWRNIQKIDMDYFKKRTSSVIDFSDEEEWF